MTWCCIQYPKLRAYLDECLSAAQALGRPLAKRRLHTVLQHLDKG
jgi:hypothetical protein